MARAVNRPLTIFRMDRVRTGIDSRMGQRAWTAMRDAAREFPNKSPGRTGQFACLLACRGAAAGLTAESADLVGRSPEEGLTVAKRNPPLANRHAAI